MKHPVFQNITRLIIWWLAWIAFAAGQSSLVHFVYGSDAGIAISDGLISMLLFGAIGLGLWFPLRYMQKGYSQTLSVIVNLLLAGMLTIIFWIFLSKFLIKSLVSDKLAFDILWSNTMVFRLVSGTLIYFMIILSYYLFISVTRLGEKASRQAQLETMLREAELKMLRSQINPHFLFNSLNSISSLTLTSPEKAREMIVKLSDFMRYSLSSRNDHLVTLRNEMESLRIYLEIEKVRFRERLLIEEKIDEECLEATLPGLLLQPLYENAVKHGVYESNKTVIIRTTIVKKDDQIIITISNTIDREAIVTRKGAGIGLLNVQSRLELFFGKEADLTISRTDDAFVVTIRLPFRTSEPQKNENS